jgi:hypothetical protein
MTLPPLKICYRIRQMFRSMGDPSQRSGKRA